MKNSTRKSSKKNSILQQPRQSQSIHGNSLELQKSKYSSLMNGSTVQLTSIQFGSKIAKLQERGNFYATKIEDECKKLKEIEQEIEKAEASLTEKRKQIMDKKREDGNQNNPVAMQKKVKAMYIKLDLLQKQQNEEHDTNEKYKEDINKLRREKNIYDNIYITLQEELQEKKEQLKKILQQSKLAKDEIQKAEVKLEHFKKDAKMDRKHFEHQLNSIYKIFDPENKEWQLEKRFNIDYNDVQVGSDHQQLNNNFITQPPQENELPPMSPEQKRKLKEEKRQQNQEKDLQELQELRKKVQLYKDTFDELRKETGKTDLDDIAKTLVKYEEDNYGLFRDINALREEHDVLQKQLKQIKQEIQRQLDLTEKNKDNQYIKKFIQLKDDIQKQTQLKNKYQASIDNFQSQMQDLKTHFPTMWNKINCNNTPYVKQIQENFVIDDIDESNMFQVLAVIERRTNDLLPIFSDLQQKQSHQNSQQNPIKPLNIHKKTEDLETALHLMDEEIEDINIKLKDNTDIIVKEKQILSTQQLEKVAEGEIQKLIQQDKPQKGKKHKRQ